MSKKHDEDVILYCMYFVDELSEKGYVVTSDKLHPEARKYIKRKIDAGFMPNDREMAAGLEAIKSESGLRLAYH